MTVTVKVSVAVNPLPSVTVNVIVEMPDCPFAGVTVTVRFPALPPIAIDALGISTRFDDVADTTRLASGVSASFTVKATGPMTAFKLPVWFPTVLIVGGVARISTTSLPSPPV